MVVDDFLGELYAFDVNNWADSMESIFHVMDFPVKKKLVCGWREFIYDKSTRMTFIRGKDRLQLSICEQIALFKLDEVKEAIVLGVSLLGNKKLRNESASDVYRFFRKYYGKELILAVLCENEIAFVGGLCNEEKKYEVIVSDWFGIETNIDVLRRIEKISICLSEYRGYYDFYLWSIARPYNIYKESKLFLLYGCGNIVTYESYVPNPEGEGMQMIEKIDVEETLKQNSSYYADLYGDDYYLDNQDTDYYDYIDEDQLEYEWTMLEMDLATEENTEWDTEYEEDSLETEDGNNDISGLNPEEMLDYIRWNKR